MRRASTKARRGEGAFGLIVGLGVLFVVVVACVRIIPLHIHGSEVLDSLNEAANFGGLTSPEKLQYDVSCARRTTRYRLSSRPSAWSEAARTSRSRRNTSRPSTSSATSTFTSSTSESRSPSSDRGSGAAYRRRDAAAHRGTVGRVAGRLVPFSDKGAGFRGVLRGQGRPERAGRSRAQARARWRPARDHILPRPKEFSREGPRREARCQGGGASALRGDDSAAFARAPRGASARASPRAASGREGRQAVEKGTACPGEGARMVTTGSGG